MKKANSTTEAPPADLAIEDALLELMRPWFQFPIDVESRKRNRHVVNLKERVVRYLSQIEDYKQSIVSLRQSIKGIELELAQLDTTHIEIPVPTLLAVREQLEAVARLPWIEKVFTDWPTLRVYTRPGMLKTRLNTRVVDCGGGIMRKEFVSEPVMVSLPQYEINIDPQNMGNGGWANTASHLGIRLINPDDISTHVAGKILRPDPHPHWASDGRGGLEQWAGLCLGEYEQDLNEASKKGLVPFLTELATYLQTSSDDHAYRPKDVWAATLGKPEYAEFCIRRIAKDETPDQIDTRYKRDYKTVHAVSFKEGAEVNPGENMTPAGAITADRVNGLLQAIDRGYFVNARPIAGNIMTAHYGWDTPLTVNEEAVEMEIDCDCDEPGGDVDGCGCEGGCDCHD